MRILKFIYIYFYVFLSHKAKWEDDWPAPTTLSSFTHYIYSFVICQSLSFAPEKEKFTVCAISICFADRLSRQIFALHFCQNTLCILFTKKKGDQFTLTASTGFYLSKSLNAFNMLSASFFDTLAFSAIAATNSVLFIFKTPAFPAN